MVLPPLIPHRPLLLAATAWLLLALAQLLSDLFYLPWLAFGGLTVLLVLGDALLGWRQRGNVRVERLLPHTLAVGNHPEVALRLHLEGRYPLHGWISDHHPPAFAAEDHPLAWRLSPGRWSEVRYRLAVSERGAHHFTGVSLRRRSPLGFWQVCEYLPLPLTVRVFPDFAKVVQYTLLATDNRLSQIGILRRRRRGEGQEFHQLRDYRREDSLRSIDWKASARARHLIAREYQDERDQQIIFLLDCGQRMATRDGELSHFDHSLNALLLLAWVALRQGDAVGLSTFAGESERYQPPKKSVTVVNELLNLVYDLQPSYRVPDYLAAAEALTKRLKKRALIVIATNLRDEDNEQLLPAVRHLRQRHAVTVASLQEGILGETARAPVEDFDDALSRAAALEYLASRRRQAALLRKAGVALLEVTPQALPVALINHYWERKRAGQL